MRFGTFGMLLETVRNLSQTQPPQQQSFHDWHPSRTSIQALTGARQLKDRLYVPKKTAKDKGLLTWVRTGPEVQDGQASSWLPKAGHLQEDAVMCGTPDCTQRGTYS